LFAWATSILLPAVLLGLAPLALTSWIGQASDRLAEATGIGAVIAIMAALAVAWIGWRPLFRLAETNFWSLNALAVQAGYALWREALRHHIERPLSSRSGAARRQLRGGNTRPRPRLAVDGRGFPPTTHNPGRSHPPDRRPGGHQAPPHQRLQGRPGRSHWSTTPPIRLRSASSTSAISRKPWRPTSPISSAQYPAPSSMRPMNLPPKREGVTMNLPAVEEFGVSRRFESDLPP
jgi:hypothetical protein